MVVETQVARNRVVLDLPPEVPEPQGVGGLMLGLPALGGLGSVAYLFAGPRHAMSYVAGGFFLVMSVAMLVGNLVRSRSMTRTSADGVRRQYLSYLQSVRQRNADEITFDESALTTRSDPVCVDAARRLVASTTARAAAPMRFEVVPGRWTAIVGARAGHLRALICAVVQRHDVDELGVAVVTSSSATWDWLRWLPHARVVDGRTCLAAPTAVGVSMIADVIGQHPSRRWLVVIDHPAASTTALRRTTAAVFIAGDARGAHRTLSVDGDLVADPDSGTDEHAAPLEDLSVAGAGLVARRLAARYGGVAGDPDDAKASATEWDYELTAEAVEDERARRTTYLRQRLSVTIGHTPTGSPVRLNLKESADGGAGPHGLIVGATGSGKSELLRTIVLGLAAHHDSTTLNLVLVDFKGGAAFLDLDGLPHTSALITNLQAGQWQVDRMLAALSGELHRRQEVLAAEGAASQREYIATCGRHAEPLPTLLVVVDEFTELLSQRPELTDLLVQIGRLGRSLGIHLLLASQRLEEGRLRGLESHLSYRIALRTFSASESRTVIGSGAAYELPAAPGHAYLKVDAADPVRFRASCLGLPPESSGSADVAVGELELAPLDQPQRLPERPTDPEPGVPSVAARILGLVRDLGPQARQIWLPPLGPIALSETPDHHPNAVTADDLQVTVGVLDRPFEQRVDPAVLDLSGSGGHVAVVGAPRSGKTTTLRTIACALQRRYGDGTAQVYCIDLGGDLRDLEALPIVGSRAGRLDAERVRRTVSFVRQVIEQREQSFPASGIRSAAELRAARHTGSVRSELGEVFLLIDGIAALRAEFEDLEDSLARIASRGLAYGVHLVISAHRWMDLRPAMRELIGSRIELRLGDPIDSQIDRRAAAAVPDGEPGRGIMTGGVQLQVAMPDGEPPAGAEVSPPIPMLPREIRLSQLPAEVRRAGVCVGVEGERMRAVIAGASSPFHLVLGDAGSGKSSHLRAILEQLPAGARIVIIDPRRSLREYAERDGVVGYASSASDAADVVDGLVDGLARRLGDGRSEPRVHLLIDDYDLLVSSTNPLAALGNLLGRARDVGLSVYAARRCAGAGRAMIDPVLGAMRELGAAVTVLSGSASEGAVCGVRPSKQPVGRGTYVDRDLGTVPIQLVTRR